MIFKHSIDKNNVKCKSTEIKEKKTLVIIEIFCKNTAKLYIKLDDSHQTKTFRLKSI